MTRPEQELMEQNRKEITSRFCVQQMKMERSSPEFDSKQGGEDVVQKKKFRNFGIGG